MSLLSSASFKSFKKSKYRSIKYTSYFSTYDMIFSNYRNKKIIFVEIGVFDGGSLFMWRDFFGPKAEIIGIDLNPAAKKWEKFGFKIYIGNQADPSFIKKVFKKIGPIDILLDDGGHTNHQQIITLANSIGFIKENGLIVIEDCHTSYMSRYGNPSKFSFISYAKKTIDDINQRFFIDESLFSDIQKNIFSVSFYESIVVFKINKKLCKHNKFIDNEGLSSDPKDFRYDKTLVGSLTDFRLKIKNKSKNFLLFKLIYKILKPLFLFLNFILIKISFIRLFSYFKK
jgi:hypothetical protein